MWLRAFESMDTRRDALQAFYTSPAWHEHRAAANATLADSDNVLLLRSARPGSGFDLGGLTRPAGSGSASDAPTVVAVCVLMLREPAGDALVTAFEESVLPEIQPHARRIAYLVTEERTDDFPALPVRDGEHAFVVAGVCASAESLTLWRRVFAPEQLPSALRAHTIANETLRLAPARRSLYR